MSRYLGQHFLHDQVVLHSIAEAVREVCVTSKANFLVEIGPGEGALTQYIDSITDHFLSIEKDTTLKKKLLSVTTKPIVRGDVLEYDLALLQKDHAYRYEQTVVVGNLPYYITSPIFTKFFVDRKDMGGGVFLIQKEVAEKLASDARKKSFLWWLVNNDYHVDYLFTVKPTSFLPPPKVDSAVIRIVKKEECSYADGDRLKAILSYLSPFKRKTLGKIEKIVNKNKKMIKIPVNLSSKRLEELSRDEVKTIARINIASG